MMLLRWTHAAGRMLSGPCLAVCIAGLAAQSAAASPQSTAVVSINLCADQLVMLLADPQQILALSSLSRDEAGSYYLDQARSHPQVRPRTEDILPFAPDIILTGPYTSRYTLALLEELGLKVESLDIAESIDAMLENVRLVGALLGQQDRAEAQISAVRYALERIDSRVAALSAQLRGGNVDLPRAAIYDANGYTAGPRSLRGELLERAGWRNAAAERNIDTYGVLQLEDMIRLAPQALIESPYSAGAYSRGQRLVRHPALRQAGLDPLVIMVPSNQTICAGPWLVDTLEILVAGREQWFRQSRAGGQAIGAPGL
jgi:iron complex transport system substrate-binding protein